MNKSIARKLKKHPRKITWMFINRLQEIFAMNRTSTSTGTSTGTSTDKISSDRVEGTNVYNQAGDKLGSVDDLIIDKQSGQVRYAVLEFGGFLGMGTDRYPLPWDMLKYDTDMDGYVVPLDKAKLNDAPHYAQDDVPSYTSDYGRRVNGYYGIGM
jgi:sporulation protein YlmC with PRC-barrel domain